MDGCREARDLPAWTPSWRQELRLTWGSRSLAVFFVLQEDMHALMPAAGCTVCSP